MNGKMKAMVFYEAEEMSFEETDIPKVIDIDVLIKVKNVGICSSDISYCSGDNPLETPDGKGPLVLGHEFTGEVVEVGIVPKKLGLFVEGDRVVVNPVQNCIACYSCSAGNINLCNNMNVSGVSVNVCFAEYNASRYIGLFKFSDNVSYGAGAFNEPLACVVYGI